MDSTIKYEPLRAPNESERGAAAENEAQTRGASYQTPDYSSNRTAAPAAVQPQYVPPPQFPPNGGQPVPYAPYPQQYQYQPQYAAPPGLQPVGPPMGYPPSAYPSGAYVAPPVMYGGPPQMGGVGPMLVISRGPVPPAPYVPPISPNDPSITSKFVIGNAAMMSSQLNYTWRGDKDVGLDDLNNFFTSQMGAPDAQIFVEAYHNYTTTRTDANGHRHTETQKKVDWQFTVDLKPWVIAPGTLSGLSLEECSDRFVRSKATIKSMELRKRVHFDVLKFNQYILESARRRGYPHQVECRLGYAHNTEKTVLLAPNEFNLCCNNSFIKCLVCITCLWICWYPMKSCMEEKFHLTQDLQTVITPEQLHESSISQIPTWSGF